MEKPPVYVRINDYEEVITMVENIKRKIHDARDLLIKLNELKAEEDRELLAWNESLDDITNRVAQIDKYVLGQ